MLRRAAWMLKRAKCAGRRAKASGSQIRIGGSVAEVVGHGLVEAEVRDRFAVGRIEGGRLVEEEVSLGRATSGRDWRRPVGQFEVEEDRGDDGWVCEEGQGPHLAATSRAEQREHFVDPCEEHGPADARWAGRLYGLVLALGGGQWGSGRSVGVGRVGGTNRARRSRN